MGYLNREAHFSYKMLATYQDQNQHGANAEYFKSGNAVPTGAWTFTPGSAIIPITIDQEYDEAAIRIDTESANHAALEVFAKIGMFIGPDVLGGGYGLRVSRNLDEVGTDPLVNFIEGHASSTQDVLKIQNVGTGYGLEIDQVGAGYGMFINSSGGEPAAYLAANKASGYCAYFLNDGNNVNRWGMGIQCGEDTGAGDNYMITFLDGDGTVHGYITLDDGTIEIEQASDRKKENVKNTKSVLNKITQLRVVDYNFKKIKGKTHTGFMDKEVRKIFPNIGKYNKKEDLYTITPLKLIPLLVKAVQELDAKVKALEG